MQTSDNNIVHVGFVVQYRIKDAFESRYRVADPRAILRDAAQAAVRGVVGRNTIDDVLSRGARHRRDRERRRRCRRRSTSTSRASRCVGIELQDVQPPERGARRLRRRARPPRRTAIAPSTKPQGYANEVLPKARAQAVELVEAAQGYKDARSRRRPARPSRFRAIASEYQKAPDVVRTRLFLETMEQVLPEVRTVIVEPGTAVMPYLPLARASRQRSARGGRADEAAALPRYSSCSAIFAALVWAGEVGVGPVVITREGEQKLVLLFGTPVVGADRAGAVAALAVRLRRADLRPALPLLQLRAAADADARRRAAGASTTTWCGASPIRSSSSRRSRPA